MNTVKTRSLSVLTALMLVLSMFAFLPEGIFKTDAATLYKQTIYVNVTARHYDRKMICFADDGNYGYQLSKAYAEGTKVTVVAKESTDEAYFNCWTTEAGTVLSYSRTYTYTVTGQNRIRASYNDKPRVHFIEVVPADNIYNSSQSMPMERYEYVMPGESVAEIGSLYSGFNDQLPYVPDGWYINGDTSKPYKFGQPVTEDVTLRLRYKEGEYKYSLNVVCSPDEGGIAVRSTKQKGSFYKYDELEIIDCDANANYRFAYWLDDSPLKKQYADRMLRYRVRGNYTVTAVFKKKESNPSAYDVVVQNGAAYAIDGATRTYEASPGTKLKIQADPSVYPNQIFEEWVVDGGGVVLSDPYSAATTFTMPSKHVAIKAKYKTIYTVSYDANGGSGYMEETYVSGTNSFTLPQCKFTAPAGKKFRKWDLGAPGDVIELTDSITLKAIWTGINDTVNITVPEPKAGEIITNNQDVISLTPSDSGVRIYNNSHTKNKVTWTNPPYMIQAGVTKFKNGTTYTLNFKLAQTYAVGEPAPDFELNEDTVVNVNGKRAEFTGKDGFYYTYQLKFTVGGLKGDVDGNGVINMKDLATLQRYVNGWDVTINESNSDLDDSVSINMKDVAALQRLINSL